MESTMTTKYSTIKHEYQIKKMEQDWFDLGCPWVVYSDMRCVGRFQTHEQALIYTIGRTEYEYASDWLLTYALVDSRWIMFIINEKRKMFCVLDNKHADSMNWRKRKTHWWLWSFSISVPKRFKREQSGVIFFADPLKTKLKQAIRGEWVKYE